MKIHFNDGWYFTTEYTDHLPHSTLQDLDSLIPVRLPHTVKELPFNYLDEKSYQMVSGYLHPLTAPEDWQGKAVLLTFGAAAHEATVFCNGTPLCTHRNGYNAFTVDLSDHLHYGAENMIAVRLDSRETLDQPPFGHVIDYLTYGGLYRGVTLEVKEPSRLADVFIHAGCYGGVSIQVSGTNTDGCALSGRILAPDGIVLTEIPAQPFKSDLLFTVPNPPVWDPDDPKLCRLEVSLHAGEVVVDTFETPIGFRTVDIRADGLYINGKKRFLRGLNRHQSWPYMGYAVPDRAQILDADILKYELGCNVVRTSHYPQSHAFINRCDKIGLLVFTEIPGWQHIGGEEWKNIAVENVREMITEYRNHPSIYIWGVRINESPDDDEFYKRTNALAHALDPSRPTGGVRCIVKSHLYEDVYTYNDFFHHGPNPGCQPKSRVTPDMTKGYQITEYNGHMFPTKSFDWEGKRLEHALRHAQVLDTVRSYPDIAGSTGWCMFDYNTHQDFGSGDRICYHGVLDQFRNHKLAAAVYAAEGCTQPVLQVSSSMDIGDYPGGNLGSVYAFTNADEILLYKNDEFVTSFRPGKAYPHLLHAPIPVDDVIGDLLEKNEGFDRKTAETIKECLLAASKYGMAAMPPKIMAKFAYLMLAKGLNYQDATRLYGKYVANWGAKTTTWKFVARTDGKEVATVTRAPVESVHLDVQCDTGVLCEQGTWDMATVRIRAVDQNGNTLPYCNRVISAQVEGPLELIGPAHFPASGGMAGTYVRTTGVPGHGRLTLTLQDAAPVILDFDITVED